MVLAEEVAGSTGNKKLVEDLSPPVSTKKTITTVKEVGILKTAVGQSYALVPTLMRSALHWGLCN